MVMLIHIIILLSAIEQWGYTVKNTNSAIDDITFPISSSINYAIVLSYEGQTDINNGAFVVYNRTRKGCNIRRWSSCAYTWIAICKS